MLVYQPNCFLLAQPFDLLGAHVELAGGNLSPTVDAEELLDVGPTGRSRRHAGCGARISSGGAAGEKSECRSSGAVSANFIK